MRPGPIVATCAYLAALLVLAGCSTSPSTSSNASSASSSTSASSSLSTPARQDLALPKGVSEPGAGLAVNADVARPDAPTLVVYEDFQCPVCARVHEMVGKTVNELAASGKVRLVFHPMVFLDDKLGNDSSKTVTNAAACAADAGAYLGYHDAALRNQPSEGTPYSSAQIEQFAKDAGLTGDALLTWSTCEAAKTYRDYVLASEKTALAGGVNGTPTFTLNGQELSLDTINPDTLVQAVERATK